jgi:hypothetical protein
MVKIAYAETPGAVALEKLMRVQVALDFRRFKQTKDLLVPKKLLGIRKIAEEVPQKVQPIQETLWTQFDSPHDPDGDAIVEEV